MNKNTRIKNIGDLETLVFLILFVSFFVFLGSKMGAIQMINTMMNTAYQLLLDTVFYIMAIAVVAGAIAGMFTEFGIVSLINKLLSPLMKPVYNLPGASAIGIMATYMSDNPAILTLAEDENFKRYFKKYQIPALTNIGTAFGMGLIVTTFMMGITGPGGTSFIVPALIGNVGAIVGSIVSVRIMLHFTKKAFGTTEMASNDTDSKMLENKRVVREGSIGTRLMESMLEGGKAGVQIGFDIIPGVLIICTIVMMLTNGQSATGEFTGAAYEGIALLPWIGEQLNWLLQPLFGFQSSFGIAVPITALGAAGAAIGLVPGLVQQGLASANDIAVFTAMCMCWSGYLSTHVAMMHGLKCSQLTNKAILAHTIGGLCAGISAHWIYVAYTMFL